MLNKLEKPIKALVLVPLCVILFFGTRTVVASYSLGKDNAEIVLIVNGHTTQEILGAKSSSKCDSAYGSSDCFINPNPNSDNIMIALGTAGSITLNRNSPNGAFSCQVTSNLYCKANPQNAGADFIICNNTTEAKRNCI